MFFLLILLLLLLVLLWIKYRNCCKPKDYTFKKGETIIVKFMPDAPQKIKDDFASKFNEGKVKFCACNNLVMYTLNQEFKAYGMDGNGVPGAMKPTPAGGQGIDSVYKNDKVSDIFKLDDDHIPSTLNLKEGKYGNSKNIKIAVLDTGIDPSLFSNDNFIENPVNSENGCFKPDSFDDSDKKHGTIVTQFLMKQFDGSEIDVKIIPFKVLDKNKVGDMFDVVCAIYAAERLGANAIVASLGYFGEPLGILHEALNFAKDKNITVFAAAGNIPENETNKIFNKIIDFLNPKDFYPATYSLVNKRVFSISSIRNPAKNEDKISWCPNQNSKKKMINAYVEVNVTDPSYKDHFCYFDKALTGTSYATPIFAGQFLKRSFNSLPLSNEKDFIKNLFDESEIVNLGEYGLAIRKESYLSL